MDDTDKVKILYEDALANKIKILPPDVNTSVYRFMPLREDPQNKEQAATMIRYGLGAIRGSGEGAIEQIIQARANGPFKDLFDFCSRLDRRVVNRRTMEALIRAGAFDSLYGGFDSRATLLASLPRAMVACSNPSPTTCSTATPTCSPRTTATAVWPSISASMARQKPSSSTRPASCSRRSTLRLSAT